MRYKSFVIENYRAINKKLTVDLEKRIIPLVGINECGKTTILQAIFCFDSSNDNEYKGKHLEDLSNLYETDHSNPAMVTACIETTPAELESIVQGIIEAYRASKGTDETAELEDYDDIQSKKNKNHTITVKMARNLKEKRYEFKDTFHNLPTGEQNKLGDEIIKHLPYILYNDDFNDRPADSISISKDPDSNKSGWEAIFDRVFKSTANNYSLNACIEENDPKLRKSILSDVEHFLNEALTNEWRKFSPKREKISIKLEMDMANDSLGVLIEDSLNGKSRFFSISNRSKGFIWYYNFIMKIRFNPKHTANIKDTIFLLDEPGSYLHETAQESLCKKLKDISEHEGIVIYCTHSPKLLLPTIIPLNNIMIIDKSSKGYISATSINNYKTSSKRNSAMQPVFEALMIPEYEMIRSTDRVLCVEGIYDKYAIETFIDINDTYIVFASVNAESIINNIQYFIAYKKEYIALWDNDDEGKKCYGKAKKVYGPEEVHFMLLPSKDSGKRRMEEMFENGDLDNLSREMGLQTPANYETIISNLYFMEPCQKKKVVSCLSEETKNNFNTLSEMIKKRFS